MSRPPHLGMIRNQCREYSLKDSRWHGSISYWMKQVMDIARLGDGDASKTTEAQTPMVRCKPNYRRASVATLGLCFCKYRCPRPNPPPLPQGREQKCPLPRVSGGGLGWGHPKVHPLK